MGRSVVEELQDDVDVLAAGIRWDGYRGRSGGVALDQNLFLIQTRLLVERPRVVKRIVLGVTGPSRAERHVRSDPSRNLQDFPGGVTIENGNGMVVGFPVVADHGPIHPGFKVVVVALALSLDRSGAFGSVAVRVVRVDLSLVLDGLHASDSGLLRETEATTSATLVDLFGIIQAVGIQMHERRCVAFPRPFAIRVDSAQRAVVLDMLAQIFIRWLPTIDAGSTNVEQVGEMLRRPGPGVVLAQDVEYTKLTDRLFEFGLGTRVLHLPDRLGDVVRTPPAADPNRTGVILLHRRDDEFGTGAVFAVANVAHAIPLLPMTEIDLLYSGVG